jgi:hypothetical protein
MSKRLEQEEENENFNSLGSMTGEKSFRKTEISEIIPGVKTHEGPEE